MLCYVSAQHAFQQYSPQHVPQIEEGWYITSGNKGLPTTLWAFSLQMHHTLFVLEYSISHVFQKLDCDREPLPNKQLSLKASLLPYIYIVV
jgi:hypothetical protein